MSKIATANRVAGLLGIRYARAVRLLREAWKDLGEDAPFTDLAHACRALKEAEDSKPKRIRGVLPKGAGAVRCISCDAESRADGKGTPIVLKHDDGCPEKDNLIKSHRYDAGHPRDDSKGCIAKMEHGLDPEDDDEDNVCGKPLTEHAHSEYMEDYP